MKSLVQLILNATAAGKSMLLAANATAQKVLLGIENVTNTSDTNKPVSTAQQTALDLKANLASPTFTGTVGAAAVTTTGLVSMGQNSSSPTLALSNTTGLQARLTDGTRTVGLLVFTSDAADALLIRNGANTGNGNLEANAALFTTLRTTSTATLEGTVTLMAAVNLAQKTIATLPSAAASNGQRYMVTDSAVQNGRIAYCYGSTWRYEDGSAV